MSAMTLFKHANPSELLAKAATLHESESGSKRLGLLPANSKTGPCLRSISGLKGQALKRWKRERQAELKVAMSREFAGLAADPTFLGRSVTVSKTGVIGFFLEPSGVSKEEAQKVAAAEERAEEAEKASSKLKEKYVASLKALGKTEAEIQTELGLIGL